MKRFLDYFIVREGEEVQQVKTGFDQLRSQISKMFGSLYRAAQNTWGKGAPSLGDRSKQEVISGLEAIIAKLKVGDAVKAECYAVSREIESLLNEADDAVPSNDAAQAVRKPNPIVSGLRSVGKAASGRDTYDMQDVLKNIFQKIMQSVGNLEQSVLGQKLDDLKKDLGNRADALHGHMALNQQDTQGRLGDLADKVGDVGDTLGGRMDDLGQDIHGVGKDVRGVGRDVQGVGDRVDRVGKKVDAGVDDIRGDVAGYGQRADRRGGEADSRHGDMMGRLAGIDKKLDSPPQPLPHAARDQAYQSIQMLQALRHHAADHGVKIVHPATGDTVDLKSLSTERGQSAVMGMAAKDAYFKLIHNGDKGGRLFNLGDVSNVDNVINTFYDDEEIDPNAYAAASKSGRPFGWTDGRKLKKVKVKGVSGSTAAEARAAQEEFEAKEAKRRNDAARKQFEDDKHECVREWLGLNVKEK